MLLDIQDIASFTDYFIIGNGTSDRMLDALADAVRDTARNDYKLHARSEGRPSDGWRGGSDDAEESGAQPCCTGNTPDWLAAPHHGRAWKPC